MLTEPLAEAETLPEGLVLVPGGIEDDAIAGALPDAEIARILGEGRIVILKGVFPAEEMLSYRRAVLRWAAEEPEYPRDRSPNSTPDVNYWRTDRGDYPQGIPHVFRQYGLNTPERQPPFVGAPTQRIAGLLLDLQNRIGGTDWDISLTGMRVKLLHYPVGGGYLTEHEHPIEPQRVGLIASMSRAGEDFASGGTAFRTPFGRVHTAMHHDIGDVILFRYDTPHAVTPVEPDRALDWESEAGKWSFVLDLRETSGLSKAVRGA